jgi:hypothetical protein
MSEATLSFCSCIHVYQFISLLTLVHLGFLPIELEPNCFYHVFVSSEYVQLSPQDRTYCRLSCTSRALLLSHTANPMPNTQHIKQQPGALVGSDEPSLVMSRHVAKYRTTEHPLMEYIYQQYGIKLMLC